MACNEECSFFTSDVYNNHNLWSCQKVCDALVYLLDNIFIRLETRLYRQTINIPMGTNCAPLVADLFIFCYERDFMKTFSRENQADIIEAFNSTSYSVSLKTLLQQDISEPEFYGDLVYRFRIIVGKSNFSEQLRKLINRYKRIGYSLDIMRQTACLVVNPIIVDGYASLFNCTTAVRASDSMTASS